MGNATVVSSYSRSVQNSYWQKSKDGKSAVGAGSSPATFVSPKGILSRKQAPRESAKQAMMRKLFDIASEKGDEVKEPGNRGTENK